MISPEDFSVDPPSCSFDQVHAHENRVLGDFREKKGEASASITRAIALSGGGIRSATFTLGVLQELARHRLLQTVDYVSSVSGGGYTNGWLMAQILRHKDGIRGVERDILDESQPRADRSQVRHLRSFSSYLTPQLDIFGPDKWTFLATYAINCAINIITVLTLLSFLGFLPLVSLWLLKKLSTEQILVVAFLSLLVCGLCTFTEALHGAKASLPEYWKGFIEQPLARYLGVTCYYICTILFVWSFRSITTKPVSGPGVSDLVALLNPAYTVVCSVLGLVAYLAYSRGVLRLYRWFVVRSQALHYLALIGSFAGLFVLIFLLMTWSVNVLTVKTAFFELPQEVRFLIFGPVFGFFWSSAVVAGTMAILGDKLSEFRRHWSYWLVGKWLLATASGVAFAGTALIGPYLMGQIGQVQTQLPFLIAVSAIAAVVFKKATPDGLTRRVARIFLAASTSLLGLTLFALICRFDINLVSPGIWQDPASPAHFWSRLDQSLNANLAGIWAASIVIMVLVSARVGNNRFSMHNFYKHRLSKCYLDGSGDTLLAECGRNSGPYPIFGASMSVMISEDLALQHRKAVSFVMTPGYCGYALPPSGGTGGTHAFVPTNTYSRKCGMSLAQVMAISGAAVTPQMGAHSIRPVAFFLCLLNARLGWWLPNPASAVRVLKQEEMRNRALTMATELFGLSRETSDQIYVSDGGFFDCLGLYELVRRECGFIVVVDAAEDKHLTFQNLADCIQRSRVDLGAHIEMDVSKVGANCGFACGNVRYSNGKTGKLLLIKACKIDDGTEDLPLDISRYAATHPNFPHETTFNQWFSESQFEAYRLLGKITMRRALSRLKTYVGNEDSEVWGEWTRIENA